MNENELTCSENSDFLKPNQELSRKYSIETRPFAKGYLAQVRKVTSKRDGKAFAAKYSPRFRAGNEITVGLHEMCILNCLSSKHCPNIIQFVEGYMTEFYYVCITELALGGDLQTLIDIDIVLLENDVRQIVEQLLRALEFIHSLSIVHLDIKPQNILLMTPFPSTKVKLCDFELSKRLKQGAEVREILGTPDYVAPEVLELEPIGCYTDIWSLGVTTYVLLTGFSPFGGDTDSETFSNILDPQPVECPIELFEDISQDGIEFIQVVLDKKFRVNRPSAKKLKDHKWLKLQQGRQTTAAAETVKPAAVAANGINEVSQTAKNEEKQRRQGQKRSTPSAGMKRLSKSTLDLTHKSRERLYEKLKVSSPNADKFKMSKSREQLWKSKINIRESMEELSGSNPAVGKWVSMDNFSGDGGATVKTVNASSTSCAASISGAMAASTISGSPKLGSKGISGAAAQNEAALSVKDAVKNWPEQSMGVILEENPELEVCQGVVAKAKAFFEKKS